MTLYSVRLALWALAMGVPALGVNRDQCPELCMISGPNPSNWTNVADINQLQACQRPMVLEFSVREPITNRQRIRVCNMWANDFRPKAFEGLSAPPVDMDIRNQTVRPELAWNPASSKKEVFGRIATVSMDNLQSYLYNKPETANTTMLFATASSVTVGVYAGANLVDRNIARLFVPLYSILNKAGLTASKSALIQVCSGRVADEMFGLVVTADQDFKAVHHAVGQWANGSCVDTSTYAERKNVNETTILVYEQPELKPANHSTPNITRSVLQARADCRTVTIVQGDLCGDLIKRCGVKLTVAEFEKLNPTKNFCNNLQVGQRACCTTGTLPDIRPKKKADGSCFSHQIKSGEYCALIAARYGLTVKEIEGFNKNTWGWNGCDYGFWPDNWMCLSDGTPPFPSPISNAICGPQKPGTKMPSDSQSKDWAKLNPCPLKACCNIWGQCGTTADFCVDTNTGPPGTAKKDTFGCISNCGMSVIKGSPPQNFIKLGYFEGFNLGRSCLNMDASQIDTSYTHIHFAFAMLDNDFNVYQQDAMAEYQFQQFKKIKGPKRIISFGGWVFSAEAPNYQILRHAVKPENREKFTDNLVKYVVDNGLDGLDIDWEYPSAPDLPGIPAGAPSEALDYLGIMSILRRKLPKDKSLSIAAPASYWYLKQFYIEAMSRSLDYIVFMTYDLHVQWDAGNKWANPGCPSGNCLRSHINMTETVNSLAMITKAGVPSSKILVGISSYGRSFQMADPSCTGPMCLFTGDRQTSFARKGRCTKTAGYISNAEINEIKGRTFIDGSQSMIMVDGDLWVSYMDDALKQSRINTYKSLNMGGTSDWAVDLAKLYPPPQDAAKLGIGWSAFKENVLGGRGGTCPDAKNPKGAFTRKTCSDEAEYWEPAKEQWDALECKSLWYWLMQVWKGCHEGKGSMRFDYAVNSILGLRGSPQCWNMLSTGSCVNVQSCKGVPVTGGHLIWNSIVGVHDIFKSYWKLLEIVGNNLTKKQEEFVTTFAPKGANGGEVVELLFSFLQIPYGIGLSRVLGSDLVKRFAPAEGARASLLESLAGMGVDTARDALASAADAREEIAFNEIFEATIASWQNQTNFILEQIFSNEGKGYKLISTLVEDGKMLAQPNGEDRLSPGSYMSTKVLDLQRAFYGAGIPMLWKADRRGPVVADFGPGCEIDARKYFDVGPSTYNVAWECINGHSYILAGVREGRQESCGIIFPDGPECPPVLQWTFDLLPGIDLLKEAGGDWQTSVREIIMGAVKTYESTGKKNRLEEQVPMSTSPSDLQEFMADQNVDIGKVPGLVRIPVCSPQTAEANLKAGIDWYTEEHGSAANWPC